MLYRLTVLFALASVAAGVPAADETPSVIAARVAEASEAGRFAEAAELAADLSRLLPHSIQAKIILARALARDGQANHALRQLGEVVDYGVRFDPDDPAWNEFRAGSEFQALVKEMESRTAPLLRSEPAFLLEKDLIPESVAYDARSGAFYVGSMYKAKIVRIDRGGEVSDFVSSGRDGLLSVLGMKIDPVRRELWAVSGNFVDRPPLQRRDPATEGKGQIFRFDLDSSDLLRSYPAKQWSAEAPLWFNDLVLSPDGTAYITAGPDGIYRLRRDDEHPEPYLKIENAFFNGITISPDGTTLFAASHVEGVIRRIDLETKEHSTMDVPRAVTLGGIDGLYFHDDSLVGIQNGVDPARVVRAWLDPEWRHVVRFTVLEQLHPLSDLPLTGVIVGSDLYYVARSQLRAFDEGT
ncbi:MAG: SMP-30/gluconolactonase/LRE family protein, partial [Acidobacteria bacterium]|nr:SMP-30/gluconolactonase/LRE family protein [Acidobacteriota bacterium]